MGAVPRSALQLTAEWISYAVSASGLLVSGGSAANVTALACAREAFVGPMNDGLVAYVVSAREVGELPALGERLRAIADARLHRR